MNQDLWVLIFLKNKLRQIKQNLIWFSRNNQSITYTPFFEWSFWKRCDRWSKTWFDPNHNPNKYHQNTYEYLYSKNMVQTKGQLISEWNFRVFKSPKKPTKFQTDCCHMKLGQKSVENLVGFLGNLKTPKFCTYWD